MNELSKSHLKELCKLKQKKFRETTGKVIIEGTRLIDQLLQSKIILEEIYTSNADKLENSDYSSSKIFHAEEFQLEKLCSTKHPQDIAALIEAKTNPIKDKKFLLYLDGIGEPGNLGTIIRTAVAAGISGIILSPDCCEVFNPKVIRASLGTVFFLPMEIHDENWLKMQDAKIIVTTLNKSLSLFDLKRPEGNIILVLGSEAEGVRKEIIELADFKVKIPISKNIESMNVAVAAGIAMYHLMLTDEHGK
ncbi:MAG: RNA methyltransferase [Candidatus Cloacimonetes bacterium]|nr:RNA methyltransferase [Candidatus Cloacimonadota bacterium]